MKALAFITVLSLSVSGFAYAGAEYGPQEANTVVEANDSAFFNVRFLGRELARVVINGDGTSDLDLIVKDRHGNVICRADGPRDVEVCNFRPENTGMYRIEVRNVGSIWNRYQLSIT